MTTTSKQIKELRNLGKHEVSAELCLKGYQLSAFGIVEHIDFFASHPATQSLRALHVETSVARTNAFGSIGEFSVSKLLIEEPTRFDIWFAFVLVQEDGFRFVVVPRNEMLRFLEHRERLQPSEGNTLRFQLFFDTSAEVFSCGYRFTPFVGLEHLYHSARYAA